LEVEDVAEAAACCVVSCENEDFDLADGEFLESRILAVHAVEFSLPLQIFLQGKVDDCF